jgi:hypothetical protein
MKFKFTPDSISITTKHFEKLHPACLCSESDDYYAELAQIILTELRSNDALAAAFSEWLWEISLKSAAYFEDVVSELGLFAGFRKMHMQMFGKKLPFFTLDDNYLDNEPNVEDIQFLIWTIMQETRCDPNNFQFLKPEDTTVRMVATIVTYVLKQEYGEAPENDRLNYMLHEHSYTDFFEFRSILDWLHYNSYLSMNYPNHALADYYEESEMGCYKDLHISDQQLLYYMKTARIFVSPCTPLAVKAIDWWNAITTNREIRNILNRMEYIPISYYRIKELNDSVIKISPILDGRKKLALDRTSFTEEKIDNPNKQMVCTALAKFGDLWQVNGHITFSKNLNKIEQHAKERKKENKSYRENILFWHKELMKHSKNRPLMFFETFNDWLAFWKVALPEKTTDRNYNYNKKQMKKESHFVSFIHETVGAITFPDMAKIIKSPDNKLYDKKEDENNGVLVLCGLYDAPLEMLEYLIKNNMLPNAKIKTPNGKRIIQDNMWFIVRFFQPRLFDCK